MIFSKPLYYIRDVKDHLIYKDKILSNISKNDYVMHNPEIKDYASFISNTDWKFADNTWFSFSLSERDQKEYVKFIYDKFKKTDLKINVAWFNQYYKNSGSEHNYHVHHSKLSPNVSTNIYYVQLEDKSLRTILKHPKTGKEVIPRVKEGQMLTFDAKIQHRSPRNFTNTRKTVISFNVRFL